MSVPWFGGYMANVTLDMLRWKRFWLAGPKCCQAWPLLLCLDLAFSVTAHVGGLRNVTSELPYHLGSRSDRDWSLLRQKWQGRIDTARGKSPMFPALFPELLGEILRDAAVPERLIRGYGSAAAEGSEIAEAVLLETKIPRSVAHRYAESIGGEGIICGTLFPEFVRLLVLDEVKLWRTLDDQAELPGWPAASLRDVEGFDSYVSSIALGYANLAAAS